TVRGGTVQAVDRRPPSPGTLDREEAPMARRALPYSSSRPSVEYLSHLGPHRVSVGELSAIGVRGVVFAPVTGPRCPAVVFGHGWLQPVGRYADTLRYLASWGFVAAAPDTARGPV